MFLLPLFFAPKKKRDNKKDLKRNHTFLLVFNLFNRIFAETMQ
jgi:hypothetical protein